MSLTLECNRRAPLRGKRTRKRSRIRSGQNALAFRYGKFVSGLSELSCLDVELLSVRDRRNRNRCSEGSEGQVHSLFKHPHRFKDSCID